MLQRQGVSDPLLVAGLLHDLRHNAVRRIVSDDPVMDCQLKCQMRYRMDCIQCVDLKSLIVQNVIIKLNHIRVFHLTDLFLAEAISNETVIHVNVIRSGGASQL